MTGDSPTRRRARRRAGVVTISWRDIPAQVNAVRGDDSAQALLPARFQHAIDRAAVVAGCTDTTSYVTEWRRTTSPAPAGDLGSAAEAEAERLAAAYPPDRLERLVGDGGVDRRGGEAT